jgi:HAD superfamily hydrolase (TIGR01509 family)
MTKIRAILFDFDGTLIDSQPVINEYLEHIFSHKHLVITNEEKKLIGGMNFKGMRAYLAKNKGITFTSMELFIYNIWFAVRHLGAIKAFPEVENFLQELSKKYKLAIVSNSPRSYLNYINRRQGIGKYFDTTVCVSESKVAKPNPKMLLMAARNLQVQPKECMMIDDNEPGITAGNVVGMTTVRIGNKKEKTKANHVCKKVQDILTLL